jgi:hypothetical protein
MKTLLIFTSFLSVLSSNAYSIKYKNDLHEDVSFTSTKIKKVLKAGESIEDNASEVLSALKERAIKTGKAQKLMFIVSAGSKQTSCSIPISSYTDVEQLDEDTIFTIEYTGEGNEIKCNQIRL